MELQAPYQVQIALPLDPTPEPMPEADWQSLLESAPAPEPVRCKIITIENGNALPGGWLRLYALDAPEDAARWLPPDARIAYVLPTIGGGWQMFVPEDQSGEGEI